MIHSAGLWLALGLLTVSGCARLIEAMERRRTVLLVEAGMLAFAGWAVWVVV